MLEISCAAAALARLAQGREVEELVGQVAVLPADEPRLTWLFLLEISSETQVDYFDF